MSEQKKRINYYPFGLEHKGYNNVVSANANSAAGKYRYNGKEIQDELGLNMYDYGARMYDPSVGKWFSIDAMAEKYYDQSTYTYTLNNPILFIDPDGNQVALCCWDEFISFVKDLQTAGSAMTTSTSQAVDNFTQPARNATQNASDVVTLVSQNVEQTSAGAINDHIATSKALYGIQAQMGGSGVGLTSGLRSGATKVNNVVNATEELADGVTSIATNEIRFSQSSVNGLDDVVESMKTSGWSGDPIDVVRMADGGLTSIDNTRVLAAHEAGIEVQAVVRNADDALPANMVERFTTKKGVPKTWGDAVNFRIQKQNSGYRNANPNGSQVINGN